MENVRKAVDVSIAFVASKRPPAWFVGGFKGQPNMNINPLNELDKKA